MQLPKDKYNTRTHTHIYIYIYINIHHSKSSILFIVFLFPIDANLTLSYFIEDIFDILDQCLNLVHNKQLDKSTAQSA